MDARDLDSLDSVLPRGRGNACTMRDLMNALGLTGDDRPVREGCEQLVNERRIPVCTLSTNPGVYVATTPEELDAADRHLKGKAGALLHRRRSLRLCREYLAYRPTLFDL